jgi:osmotically-inducible protein OsmY
LDADPVVAAEPIKLSLDRGIVTLQGSATNLLAKERAQALAEEVRGVRAVINLIEVHLHVPASDATVLQRVREALHGAPAVDANSIRVSVAKGAVTLRGYVSSLAEEELAVRAAQSVAGVRSVESELALSEQAVRKDSEIAAEVAARLRADPSLDAGFIRVKAEHGVVTLAGTVGRIAERNRAAALAQVRGVKDIDVRQLYIEPWAREPNLRTQPTADLPANEIERTVRRALADDPRVDSERVKGEVREGHVLLSGVAQDDAAREAAAQDAASALGVKHVDNLLRVAAVSNPTRAMEGADAPELQAGGGRPPRTWTRQDVLDDGTRASIEHAVVLAFCQRQQFCGFIRAGSLYGDVAECVARVSSLEGALLSGLSCKTDIAREAVDRCLLSIRSSGCASPFSEALVAEDCARDRMCRSEP